MSTTYTGVPGNVSLAAPITEIIPADAVDTLGVASVNTPLQKLADYIAALAQSVPVAVFAEGFESATFPPNSPPGAWATPSPRFGSDLAWVRTTTNPIAGTASASAPVPQGTTTNSSLGLTITLASPARLFFQFAVNGNANTSDHLDFYVDGVLTMSMSTQVSNTLVGGRFPTDLLREGPHTFDWRWVRGGSASVGSEECKIDVVEIIPEEVWRGDPTRLYTFDDAFTSLNAAVNIATPNKQNGPWIFDTSGNVGNYIFGSGALNAMGAFALTSAATAAADWARAALASPNAFNAFTTTPFTEFRLHIPTLNANEIVELGWLDIGAPTAGNFMGWAWDGSLGVGSTWRWRGIAAGVATTVDSNVAIAAATWFRLGMCAATVRGVSSVVFTKDGKALPGAASIPPLMVTGLPSSTVMFPAFRVRSVTAAFAASAVIDWIRLLALRP